MYFFPEFDKLFMIVFTLIIVTFVIGLASMIKTWFTNNASPRLNVNATVVGKRKSVTHHTNNQGMGTTTSTTYYVTFEVDSGDRMEFYVSGREYGLLVEGDRGELFFQGTRYLEFNRY